MAREDPYEGFHNLDFSIFHDLFHSPFNKKCRGMFPKGWKSGFYHIKLLWIYKYSEEIKSHTLCRIGIHKKTTWYSPIAHTSEVRCRFCVKLL